MADVHVSIPDDLLSAIDAEAARRSLTRELLLLEAARNAVAQPDPGSELDGLADWKAPASGATVGDPLMW